MKKIKEYIKEHGEDESLYKEMDSIVDFFKANPEEYVFIENILLNKVGKLSREAVQNVSNRRELSLKAIAIFESIGFVKSQELKSLKGHKRYTSTNKIYQLDSIFEYSKKKENDLMDSKITTKQNEIEINSIDKSKEPRKYIQFLKWVLPLLVAIGILIVSILNYNKKPFIPEVPKQNSTKVDTETENNRNNVDTNVLQSGEIFKQKRESNKTEKSSIIKNELDEKDQVKKYFSSSPMLKIGNSFVDKLTKVSLGGSDISSSRQMTGLLTLPNNKTIEFKNKTAGSSWQFEYESKSYKIILRNVLYIEGKFSVEIHEL